MNEDGPYAIFLVQPSTDCFIKIQDIYGQYNSHKRRTEVDLHIKLVKTQQTQVNK